MARYFRKASDQKVSSLSANKMITKLKFIILALAIVLVAALQTIEAQSTKGSSSSRAPQSSYAGTQAQQRQPQQQRVNVVQTSSPASSSTKRRLQQQQQQQPIEQQQVITEAGNYQRDDQQQQLDDGGRRRPQAVADTTEDPLADSEPALYGSVAGQPGVDFPAYTRIPKTSFTCEGKGFDFGFYADEEAQCQVYHVCWSGRRESFLCGVGTVFNQAILACDYWHSVDCSKSSQFYGVNSELGKAGAEPASGASNQGQSQQRRPIQAANLPASNPQFSSNDQQQTSSSSSLGQSYNEPQQRRFQQQQPIQQQQQQQYDEQPNFDRRPSQSSSSFTNNYASQRLQPNGVFSSQDQQQQRVNEPQLGVKGVRNQPQVVATTTGSAITTTTATSAPLTTTLATPPAAKRPRFMNMDFNQKVNSLIESPVRPPLKTAPTSYSTGKQQQPARQANAFKSTTTGRPGSGQQQQQTNFAQQAVTRAQQVGSQTLNAGPARKSANQQAFQKQQQQQVQVQQFDNDLDEPQQQQQQQQQAFDDSPVQTSTTMSPTTSYNPAPRKQQQQQQFGSQRVQGADQPQQLVIQAGGGPDGSSAITTQYDTISAPGSNQQGRNVQQQQQDNLQSNSYELSLDDSTNSNDDFRSAGAKAAASQNQNWYIMRTI